MKILKAFLLTFVISFIMNDANAQKTTTNPPLCNDPEFGMQVERSQVEPVGHLCFNVTVTSGSPQHLFIKTIEGCLYESATTATSFTTTVCFGPNGCGESPVFPFNNYITCGADMIDGAIWCREGCDVIVEL